MEQKWLPQVKFLGSYTVPKIDVQIGASFQSIPGIEEGATYAAPNTDLARPPRAAVLAACRPAARRSERPLSVWSSRVRSMDDGSIRLTCGLARLSASVSTRSNLSLDVFNLFNSDVISGASTTYSTWLAPNSVVAPRLLKVSATFDF